MYPPMLQHLFVEVGFGWGVRISGLVGTVCCLVAVATVTNVPTGHKCAPSVSLRTVIDTPFLLLAGGGCFVALGELGYRNGISYQI